MINIDDLTQYNENDYQKQVVIHNMYNNTNSTSVVIVGCGGTGARLLNLIAQQVASNPLINICLVDDGLVEYSNLKRQLFYEFEVGKPKVHALKARYETLYKIYIKASSNKIEHIDPYIYLDTYEKKIVFDCTDNVEARIAIIDKFKKFQNTYIIACGNEKDFGQVMTSYINDYNSILYKNQSLHKYENVKQSLINVYQCQKEIYSYINFKDKKDTVNISYLPNMLNYWKNLQNTEALSCGIINMPDEQSIAINSTMAQLAYNMFTKIMQVDVTNINVITWGNLDNNYTSITLNTFDDLIRYYAKTIYGKNLYESNMLKCKTVLTNLYKIVDNFQISRADKSHEKPIWFEDYIKFKELIPKEDIVFMFPANMLFLAKLCDKHIHECSYYNQNLTLTYIEEIAKDIYNTFTEIQNNNIQFEFFRKE